MAKAKTKTKTANKPAEKAPTEPVTKDATKPTAEERAQKAADAKNEHRTKAMGRTKELIGIINDKLEAIDKALAAGKTAPKDFDDLHAATAEFKVEVNRLGIHARPQAAKAKG